MNIRTFLSIIKSKFRGDALVTLEQVNDALQRINELEIKYQKLVETAAAKSANNLTVVSQKLVSECGEILEALTRRRGESKS